MTQTDENLWPAAPNRPADHHTWRERILLVTVLALAGIGAWTCGQLLRQHANLWGGPAAGGVFTLMCAATEKIGFSCGQTLHSAWSEVRFPVPVFTGRLSNPLSVRAVTAPVAFFGLAYFVFMGAWFAFAGPAGRCGRAARVVCVIGVVGALASLFFVGVMALTDTPWCIWCLVVHATNGLLLLALWRLMRRSASTRAWTPVRLPTRPVLNAAAFALIIIAALWHYRSERITIQSQIDRLRPYKGLVTSLRQDPAFLLREYHAQPTVHIPPRGDPPVTDTRARLVVFTDFECPACYRQSHKLVLRLRRSFASDVSVSVRHYPLCHHCNDQVKTEFHPNACQAAYAAEAARRIGGEPAFWRMHDLLFNNRENLGEQTYRQLAARINLDAERFMRELSGPAVKQAVADDVALGKRLGVHSTPTMFLNDRRVPAICRTPRFWDAIGGEWSRTQADKRVAGADSSDQKRNEE